MQQLITKFGGTSVSSRENWEHIVNITRQHCNNGMQPIIVCSALSKASDSLEHMINMALENQHTEPFTQLSQQYVQLAVALDVDPEVITSDLQQLKQWLAGIALLGEAPAKTRAQILSLGEIMITRLGYNFLTQQGFNCLWFDVREALLSETISGGDLINYLSAHCDSQPNPMLAKRLADSGADVIITQGFIAINQHGDTVLLGRGGSDTSAALLAAILEATACEIWTDVPGIYTANPHDLPQARLLKQLNYDEAHEIAAMGAKVLHPYCLAPVQRANIPMIVKYTCRPDHSGTRISSESDNSAPPIKSIQVRHNITLMSINATTTWRQVDFLADVFTTFKQHGFLVSMLSSSESNVTLLLDSPLKRQQQQAMDDLIDDLNQFSHTKIIEPCSTVSLVGQRIRNVIPKLKATLEVFDTQQAHLVSLASNDLNLTFVVDQSEADRLYPKLHNLLIENNPQSYLYSKSWQEEFGNPVDLQHFWWENERDQLLKIGDNRSPCYVYNPRILNQKAHELLQLNAINQVFFAIKANSNQDILKILYKKQISFECVSIQELKHIVTMFPEIDKQRILFTPNFAAKTEYEFAISLGCYLTIDSLYPLEHWPELFTNQSILLRIDLGYGAGHHKYVRTGGNESKFGIPKSSLTKVHELAKKYNIRIIGLHSHSGSGILTPDLWLETAIQLCEISTEFPDVHIINLGGGLGIPEKPGHTALNLLALDNILRPVCSQHPHLKFWLEPGRYFVAECGIILTKVTQSKTKGSVDFIGVDVGMNSLLRPALYNAYHPVINLTRINEEKIGFSHIAGPICESGDILHHDCFLPKTHENDILLIANTGAYGFCMSSSYNLRPPAEEIILEVVPEEDKLVVAMLAE